MVWNADGRASIPVSPSAQANLRASIDAMAANLRPWVKKVGDDPKVNAWAAAEIWLALQGLDFGVADPGRKLRDFMTKERDSSCYCWRETADVPPHTLVTAWVLYALARYNQPATVEEIESVLQHQSRSGWWAMFPATPDESNASTSATAWTALALHHQLELKLVAPSQQPKVEAAIQKAADWLARSALSGKARWSEYPPGAIFEQGEYLAVSALTVHTLHVVAALNRFNAPWLEELPRDVPRPAQNESAKGVVALNGIHIKLDDSRHYRFPWMLRTTVESYPSGNRKQRARAVQWVEEAFKAPLRPEDVNFEYWTMAEILFALRHVEAELDRSPAQN